MSRRGSDVSLSECESETSGEEGSGEFVTEDLWGLGKK